MTDKPDPHFTEAEAWLRDRNISSRRTSKYQLKIGRRVSFYPNKGTILSTAKREPDPIRGLAHLKRSCASMATSDVTRTPIQPNSPARPNRLCL